MVLLRISELAERSGVASSTLRFYERIGLVEPLGRADNGYRVYDEASVQRLEFIARAKRLGMTLDDVATLVDAWHQVLAMATGSQRIDGGLRVVFDPSAEVIKEVARLCAAETACCPLFIFGLAVTAGATVLTIQGPADADDLIGRFFEFSGGSTQR